MNTTNNCLFIHFFLRIIHGISPSEWTHLLKILFEWLWVWHKMLHQCQSFDQTFSITLDQTVNLSISFCHDVTCLQAFSRDRIFSTRRKLKSSQSSDKPSPH
jgi:hypothetical protein